MTENLPAVPAAAATREVANQDTDSWIPVLAPVIELAKALSTTDFVPRGLRGSATATAAAILYGREVGLPPMTALTQTHVIEGKPAMSAEAMRAMVLSQGHALEIVETTGTRCVMRARRANSDNWTTLEWTIDLARQAGVAGKGVWKNYPRQMLQARTTTELCRLVFPDVIHGFRSLEEFNELEGAVVEDEDGNTAPTSGTKVTRKRAARKTAAAPPAAVEAPAAPAASSVEDGPPLPGADDHAPAPVAESSAGGDDGGAAGGVSGEDVASPVDDDQDVHDAVLVEDPPYDEPPAEEPVVDEHPEPGPSTRAQHRMLFSLLGGLGVSSDEERLLTTSVLVGREIGSFNGLTKAEASTLVETLGMFNGDRAKLLALLAEAEA
ncbi:hypothetical protein ACFFOS_27525 [Nocardioides kongjuensis]|uniref:Recombinase RecT n=1 Tax=Nocardioides kongjuensis TaxID=349522 RepID=A0A852S185_9ACTN|nr:hypothetical protein [Nocardioides kongjuensis]NYD33874.1 hypothetical protein [Nocardioides kongjuensis]